jgi:hypothetical protein
MKLYILFLSIFFTGCFSFPNENILSDVIDFNTINEVRYSFNGQEKIIAHTETAILLELKNIKKSDGIWKYWGKQKIFFYHTNGQKDTLYTNGTIFEYKGKFFVSSKKIIDI